MYQPWSDIFVLHGDVLLATILWELSSDLLKVIGVKKPAMYPTPKRSSAMANISAAFVAVQHLFFPAVL